MSPAQGQRKRTSAQVACEDHRSGRIQCTGGAGDHAIGGNDADEYAGETAEQQRERHPSDALVEHLVQQRCGSLRGA